MMGQYLKTRFPASVYLPCAIFLVTAAMAGGRSVSPWRALFSLLPALTLLLQFRLWDDLSDIDRVRAKHPDRVMAREESLTPFISLTAALFAVNLLLLAAWSGPARRLEVFLFLNAAYLVWYHLLKGTLENRVLAGHAALVKYPTFVFLLSGEGGDTWPLLLAMVLVLLCFSIYETLHDSDLNLDPSVVRARRLEEAALLGTALLMALRMADAGGVAAVAQGVGGVAAFLVLRELYERRGLHLESPGSSYAVFALGFALIVNFLLGSGG